MPIPRAMPVLALAVVVAVPRSAATQPLGTFSWQLQPFCNRVTVKVVQTTDVYTLDGFDDQCGGTSPRVPLTGLATPNPDGTIQFGLALVVSTGLPLHVTARISPLAGFSGTWQDSQGHGGAFAFGANVTGTGPRPGTTSLLRDGEVTSEKLADDAVDTTKIAPGAVGQDDINATEVQRRVSGTCPAGQTMTAVNPTGSVECAVASGGGDITAVTTGAGLTGGGESGDVAIAIANAGVVGSLLAADAVDSSKIANGSVLSEDLGAGAVTSDKILDGTITAGDLASSSVIAAKIAAGAVVTAALASDAVTSAKIVDGTIVAADLASNAVTAAKIAADAISNSTQIATDTIEMSDLRRVPFLAVATGSLTVPARGCFVNSVSTTQATLAGDLLTAGPNGSFVFPVGIYTMPLTVQIDGHAGFALCNGTASNITSTFALNIIRVPR